MQLPSSYSIDFVEDPAHPRFGPGVGGETLGLQVTAGSGTLTGRFVAPEVVLFDAGEPGTFERCLNDTRYQQDVDVVRLGVGSKFCVHTPGGRFALVWIDRLPDPADANPYAVIDVTVWQGR